GGVGDVDALGAVGLHQLGLLGELGGGGQGAHHQEAGGVEPELAGGGDVLRGDVGLGAVRGDAYVGDAGCGGVLELANRAAPWEQERGDGGVPCGAHRGLDQLEVRVPGEAVGDGGAGQAVAVGHLDAVD